MPIVRTKFVSLASLTRFLSEESTKGPFQRIQGLRRRTLRTALNCLDAGHRLPAFSKPFFGGVSRRPGPSLERARSAEQTKTPKRGFVYSQTTSHGCRASAAGFLAHSQKGVDEERQASMDASARATRSRSRVRQRKWKA